MPRWAGLGLLISVTAYASSAAAFGPVVGLNLQAGSGTFDAAGQKFTEELRPHALRAAYKHGNHDLVINWAAQRGMGVLFFLGYGIECNVKTASGRQCYANRSAALAKFYGDKVQYYEVWNEWNGGYGLGSKYPDCLPTCADGAMYTDLLCRTYKAVKAVQPNAIIVGGATAGVDTTFIGKMLDKGAKKCMNMLSVHPYVYNSKAKYAVPYDSPGSVGVNKFVQAITAAENLIWQKTGTSMPILVTETGRNDMGVTANEQITADYLRELYKRAPSIPFLEGIWWFCLEDIPNKGGFGLVRGNNTKKPAFAKYQAAADQ